MAVALYARPAGRVTEGRSAPPEQPQQASRLPDFGRKRNGQGDAPRGAALQKAFEMPPRRGAVSQVIRELSEHELPVALAAGGFEEPVSQLCEVPDGIARRSSRQACLGEVERLRRGAPPGGPRQHARRFPLPPMEVQRATEGPEMKRAARSRAFTAGDPQMDDGAIHVVQAETRSSSILPRDIHHDASLDHLLGDLERIPEAPCFHVGQVQLPQEQGLCGRIRRAMREPARRVFGA